MTRVFIYVEGKQVPKRRTRKRRSRQTARTAFKSLLGAAGIKTDRIEILACGGGSDTYKRFKAAFTSASPGDIHILLVDSELEVQQEFPLEQARPWDHLQRINMPKPSGATDNNAHMMVRCYEVLILADIDALEDYYGDGFHFPATLKGINLENQSVDRLAHILNAATAGTKKKCYDKGAHAYEILANVSPEKIEAASPWAKRFLDYLRTAPWESDSA